MTPAQFIATWKDNKLTERAGAQAHFDDLCDLLGVAKPRDPDNYCFERGAKKTGGGDGWADVWKRDHFGWENKKPGRDLNAALKQLTDYALELENPPLLVVCDRERIVIHTAFTGYPDEPREIRIADIGNPENLQTLRWVFTDPARLKPVKSLAAITAEAAARFGELAESLRGRDLPPEQVAHFLTQCLFCMFAEDEGLLPENVFTRLLEKTLSDPARAGNRLATLFKAMQKGGDYGDEIIPWFNGGLFLTIAIPELSAADVAALQSAAAMDWRAIDPSIFGTLFERGLNPKKRAQLGAHYTDPATIIKLIDPVIRRPLLAEWETARATIAAALARSKKQGDKAWKEAAAAFHGMLERLKNYRVLDAACGSGNFLYLALKTLKDIERRINTEAEQLGLQRQVGIEVSPANVLGIELDPYAAELARVTVWIGEIQWMRQNGYPISDRPILKPLATIENRDALLTFSPRPLAGEGPGEREFTVSEADWPACDAIVGNPPFLGGTKKRRELGDAYFEALAKVYGSRVPPGADLVCYWFQKAQEMLEHERCFRVGLVATNSIRQQANRKVLDRIFLRGNIFEAWSDEAWINDGAAVRVSLVCYSGIEPENQNSIPLLDGKPVKKIYADLRSGCDLTSANSLIDNESASYFGLALAGEFSVEEGKALMWLTSPNPNGRPNSDVVKRLWNGQDLTGRWNGRWVVDFGPTIEEKEAMLYEKPYEHILEKVKPVRALNNRKSRAEKWWRHGEARPAMRRALSGLKRYIVTSEKSKHRFFAWLDITTAPDNRLVVIAREDDVTFGILSSRIHVCWALAVGSTLEDRPAYATTTCFETFPFPEHLTPRDTAGWGPGATICDSHEAPPAPSPSCAPATSAAEAIAAAARALNELRDHWLNPPQWVDWVSTPEEDAAGFPKRPVAKPGFEAELKKRTLTNLYNSRPAWLAHAHEALDRAVAAAYGWADYTSTLADDEILRRLLALNQQRSRSHTNN